MAETKTKTGKVVSIKYKIILLTVAAVVVACIATLVVMTMTSKSIITKEAQNLLFTLSDNYGGKLEKEAAKGAALDTETYSEMLSDLKITGLDGAYAYVVDEEGIMVYHPTESKIGNPVTNSVVSGLVNDLKNGKFAQDACVSYTYNGAVKYAAYNILTNHHILVVTADEDVVLAELYSNNKKNAFVVVIVCLIFAVVAWFVGGKIAKPITQISEIIKKTAALDFTHNENSSKLKNLKDECGAMAVDVSAMRGKLRDMVAKIQEASTEINEKLDGLSEISNKINVTCTDNSATTEELAAGMQETAATTETIVSNIGNMRDTAGDIRDLSKEGEDIAREIMKRAEALKASTVEASNRTTGMYEDVKIKTAEAIEDSKAVDKINELTDAIVKISSQTSLLALNASIEAARAGEAGRGFAVVATEIGNLANETFKTVGNIKTIVEEVQNAVSKMTKCLTDTTKFLEEIVLKDYDQFMEVSTQYNSDAGTIENSMTHIEGEVERLTALIGDIAEALNGISATVSEATIGVTDIAGKTSDMVSDTIENNMLTEACGEKVKDLNQITSMFKIANK